MNEDSTPAEILEEMPDKPVRHYYGDHVRRLFIAGAVCELAALPFFHDLVPILPAFSVIVIALGVVGLAGLTTPRNKTVASINVCIAGILFIIFEYLAVNNYDTDSTLLSIARQIIALIYLVAVYFGIKTARNMEDNRLSKL